MIFDAAGNLWGTAWNGGVYELTPNGSGGWTFTVVYMFGPAPDGNNPYAGLVMDSLGNFYGTTSSGGTYGYGTVFEITP